MFFMWSAWLGIGMTIGDPVILLPWAEELVFWPLRAERLVLWSPEELVIIRSKESAEPVICLGIWPTGMGVLVIIRSKESEEPVIWPLGAKGLIIRSLGPIVGELVILTGWMYTELALGALGTEVLNLWSTDMGELIIFPPGAEECALLPNGEEEESSTNLALSTVCAATHVCAAAFSTSWL